MNRKIKNKYFLRFNPLGLYLLQHMFYIGHADTFSVKLWNRFSFFGGFMSVKRGVEAQSPVFWIVIRTCTHLRERGYLLLYFRNYVLSHVFKAIWQILKSRSHMLHSKQTKTRKILALAGDWTQDLSFLSLLPCHLSHHTSAKIKKKLMHKVFLFFVFPLSYILSHHNLFRGFHFLAFVLLLSLHWSTPVWGL